MPSGAKRTYSQMSGADADIKIPYLTNPKNIDAHTMLLALDDEDIAKVSSSTV